MQADMVISLQGEISYADFSARTNILDYTLLARGRIQLLPHIQSCSKEEDEMHIVVFLTQKKTMQQAIYLPHGLLTNI